MYIQRNKESGQKRKPHPDPHSEAVCLLANLRCDERADPAEDGAGPDADAPDHGREYLAAAKEDADEDGQGNALTKETTKNVNVNAGTCT